MRSFYCAKIVFLSIDLLSSSALVFFVVYEREYTHTHYMRLPPSISMNVIKPIISVDGKIDQIVANKYIKHRSPTGFANAISWHTEMPGHFGGAHSWMLFARVEVTCDRCALPVGTNRETHQAARVPSPSFFVFLLHWSRSSPQYRNIHSAIAHGGRKAKLINGHSKAQSIV